MDRSDFLANPPVSSASSPASIRAWLRRLEQIRLERAEEPDLIRVIDTEYGRAQAWLERASPRSKLQ